MSSILDMLNSQLGQGAIQQIGQQLGMDEKTTQSAIGSALPVLLGALGRNASTTEGAEALNNALDKEHDGSILNNVEGALGNSATVQDGQAILGHILGSKQDGIESALGRMSGIDSGTTSQLLSMLAPVVLGQLGQAKQQNGLDASGLANLLGGEQKTADSALGGLAGLLDADGDGSIVDDVIGMGSKLLGRFM